MSPFMPEKPLVSPELIHIINERVIKLTRDVKLTKGALVDLQDEVDKILSEQSKANPTEASVIDQSTEIGIPVVEPSLMGGDVSIDNLKEHDL